MGDMTTTPTSRLPVGQEATLLALAAAMFRNAALAAAGTVAVAVLVAAALVGTSGALGAAVGGTSAFLASLITLWLMRGTATMAPQAVMLASYGGFTLKMIVLLAVLFMVDSLGVVHRESLAMSMLAVLIAITAAEGVASYRMPTLIVDPVASTPTPTTSGSMTGLPDSATSGPRGVDGRPAGVGSRPDHEE